MKTNEKIKRYRNKLGWSQKDLINATGIAQGRMSQIENGGILPKSEVLKKIAEALKVSLQELFPDSPTSHYVEVLKPQSDEEALTFRFYMRFADLHDSDSKYLLLKEFYFEIKKFIERKENYLRDIDKE